MIFKSDTNTDINTKVLWYSEILKRTNLSRLSSNYYILLLANASHVYDTTPPGLQRPSWFPNGLPHTRVLVVVRTINKTIWSQPCRLLHPNEPIIKKSNYDLTWLYSQKSVLYCCHSLGSAQSIDWMGNFIALLILNSFDTFINTGATDFNIDNNTNTKSF